MVAVEQEEVKLMAAVALEEAQLLGRIESPPLGQEVELSPELEFLTTACVKTKR
jgi:hypothetical protein